MVTLSIESMKSSALDIDNIQVNSYDNASEAITTIDEAISIVSKERSILELFKTA